MTKYDNDGPNLEEEQMLEAEARRRGISVRAAKPEAAEPVRRGSGWAPERPLDPPPGVAIMDQMMDAQDAVDRRALAKRLGG